MMKTAPLPILGLEADQEREARRQRRMLAAGQASLIVSSISLAVMLLGSLLFVLMIGFPTLARYNESHGNLFFASALVMIFFLSLPGALIGYIVSRFAAATPISKRGGSLAGITFAIFVAAILLAAFLASLSGDAFQGTGAVP